jgi:hypothetical protein
MAQQQQQPQPIYSIDSLIFMPELPQKQVHKFAMLLSTPVTHHHSQLPALCAAGSVTRTDLVVAHHIWVLQPAERGHLSQDAAVAAATAAWLQPDLLHSILAPIQPTHAPHIHK